MLTRTRPVLRVILLILALSTLAVVIAGSSPSKGQEDMSTLQTLLRGQSQWLANGPASVRVIVSNHETGKPVRGKVRVSITPTDQQAIGEQQLYSGKLKKGTVDAQFTVPAMNPGTYEMTVKVDTPLGQDVITRPVTIRHETQIMLTTDKPLYQPGQTIHLRALALQRPSVQPAAGSELTFEVMDAKGNKVLKKKLAASKYGVASTTFVLANEINMGRYIVRVISQNGKAERTVDVKRYVLPKFKINATTDKPYYLPGEKLSGKVQVDYFFGKPTFKADVLITLSAFDVSFRDFATIKGKTDENGSFEFEENLPDYFVSQPLEEGNTFVKMDVEITDLAEHTEKITNTVPIAKDPIVITVVPESGTLKPGLKNVIYVLASSPDGKPLADAGVKLTSNYYLRNLFGATDKAGIYETEIPISSKMDKFRVTIKHQGREATKQVNMVNEKVSNALILRVDKSIAKVGTKAEFNIISTKLRGSTYVDVIRDNQTILTWTVDLKGGKGSFSLPLTQDMQGTLLVHAYQILPDENIIRDTRLMYVEPADDLVVEVKPNLDTYRPGKGAQLSFTVRDQNGNPTQAALGVTIVDESVFALQEMQPGLERIYFALEKELLQPRYEIHGFTSEGLISGKLPFATDKPAEDDATRQRAAAVLFAATKDTNPHTLMVNTYEERLEKAMAGWVKGMARDAENIDRVLKNYYQKHRAYLKESDGTKALIDEGFLKRSELLDRWSNEYKVHWNRANSWLDSAGPDKKWNTKDDLISIGQWAKDGNIRRFKAMRLGGVAGGGPGMMGPMGAVAEREEIMDFAMPMAATVAGEPKSDTSGQPQVRLRQFFPETMYVNPSIITDDRGKADVTVEMVDSITTWRLQALASSQKGQLGSATEGLRVFQDFFIDIDLPVALTQNDEISIPIAVYNYLPTEQTVKLSLETQPWFELVNDEADKSLDLAASDIRVVYYRIRAKKIGTHALTVHATGSRLSDAIKRQITVMPDGEERRDTWNDMLDGTITKEVVIPQDAIEDASTILVKIYPGLFSQAVEGLDSMLRMPFGCFEQTSSVTYPNILVLDYLKSTKRAKPELEMKAEQYINVGYQRLLSFEVQGGGFSWFGNPPAHKVLTAYGLLEFQDMSRVHEVDRNVINRTQNWLASLQQKDGSWEQDKGGISEGIINRQTDVTRTTAYITWALVESGYMVRSDVPRGDVAHSGLKYLETRWQKVDDPYALAVIALAYLSADPESKTGAAVIEELAEMAVVDDKTAYWKSTSPTFTSAKDKSADLETTALATYALIKSGRHVDLTNKAITYLIRSKDSFGTWNTTQATVWALKALLLSLEKAAAEIDADVTITVNGKQLDSFHISQDNYEVVRQVDAKSVVKPGANTVKIALNGKGSALYQITGKYYIPWRMIKSPIKEALSIDVDYDRTSLATDDILTATVKVTNNDPRDANMVVIDLGLPPGFDVITEDLESMVAEKSIEKYSIAARQIIIYLDKLAAKKPLTLSYRMRAKFPIKAATPSSTVYRYYNPEIKATAKPVELTVK